MPPRYAYWTILIDNGPTAFRAAKREDLVPTFVQLQRTNPNIVMKWFARGRLWDSPEAERAAQRQPRFTEKRGPDWRPGGAHKDPRARFDKRQEKFHRPRRDNDIGGTPGPTHATPAGATPPRAPDGAKPLGAEGAKPFTPGGGQRPFRPDDAKPIRSGGDKPFRTRGAKPFRPGGSKPFRPGGGKPFRPGGGKPFRPGGAKPFQPGPRRDRRK